MKFNMVEGSAATSFSRDKIGVEQLQNLKERFEDDLNEKEFVDLFIEISRKASFAISNIIQTTYFERNAIKG